MCGEDIDVLKGLLKKEEYKLSFKIYNGAIASLHGAMVGKQKVSQKVAYFRPSNSMALHYEASFKVVFCVLILIHI